MEPRRSKSSKSSALPKDYVKQVVDALKESFADETKSGKFIVEGRIFPDEILIRMGFLENGRLRQTNFEISVDYKAGKDDTVKLLNLAVDVGATMLEELFSATDDADFPRTWKSYEVEGREVFLQFSSINSQLDKEAAKLLGEDPDQLVQSDEDAEELEAIKAKLGISDEDDDGGQTEH